MEKSQLEDMTDIIQDTWLPIMRGADTIGETHISERDAIRIANNLIEANYIKQREGKWIRPRPFLPCHCSECLATYTGRRETPAYCPDCGAKMSLED